MDIVFNTTDMQHELVKLPYEYAALEPHLDAKTMEIHHSKHHQSYVDKLNTALATHPELSSLSLEEICRQIPSHPDDIKTAVRNNGGGTYNHNFFWSIMSPNFDQAMPELLGQKLTEAFGSFDAFRDQFAAKAVGHFASGWAWLILNKEGKMEILSQPDHWCPLADGLKPLLVLDVWEHAYYLKFQNRRAEYIDSWFHTVNWEAVANNLSV